jgi:hypothetical protein
MTTIVQFVPKWLRVRVKKAHTAKLNTHKQKKRQLLPTLPSRTRSVTPRRTTVLRGRLLWRL